MLIFRFIVLGLIAASAVSLALYLATRDRRWLVRMNLVLRWAVISGLAFFAVLLLEKI